MDFIWSMKTKSLSISSIDPSIFNPIEVLLLHCVASQFFDHIIIILHLDYHVCFLIDSISLCYHIQ